MIPKIGSNRMKVIALGILGGVALGGFSIWNDTANTGSNLAAYSAIIAALTSWVKEEREDGDA